MARSSYTRAATMAVQLHPAAIRSQPSKTPSGPGDTCPSKLLAFY